MSRSIHISTACKILNSGDPVDNSGWLSTEVRKNDYLGFVSSGDVGIVSDGFVGCFLLVSLARHPVEPTAGIILSDSSGF